jgi:uncharacterized SAM-binding protein YcdF (DUF218 family)
MSGDTLSKTGGHRRAARIALLVCLAAIGALALVGPYAGLALVVSVPVLSPDAIVSLASHEWERLPVTAKLAADNPYAFVILTLPQPVTKYNCHDCANRSERLTRSGVDSKRIKILPITASGTHGEALSAREFVSRSGIKRLMVVTSPYHTRRALATFKSVLAGTGVEVGVTPAITHSPARPDRWWSAPYDRAYVRYEWAGLVYYWLRYHVPL